MGVTKNHILIIVIHKLVAHLKLTHESVDVHSGTRCVTNSVSAQEPISCYVTSTVINL